MQEQRFQFTQCESGTCAVDHQAVLPAVEDWNSVSLLLIHSPFHMPWSVGQASAMSFSLRETSQSRQISHSPFEVPPLLQWTKSSQPAPQVSKAPHNIPQKRCPPKIKTFFTWCPWDHHLGWRTASFMLSLPDNVIH